MDDFDEPHIGLPEDAAWSRDVHQEALSRKGASGACEACGAVAEVSSEPVFTGISETASKSGFKPRMTLVEVIGRCAQCAVAA